MIFSLKFFVNAILVTVTLIAFVGIEDNGFLFWPNETVHCYHEQEIYQNGLFMSLPFVSASGCGVHHVIIQGT